MSERKYLSGSQKLKLKEKQKAELAKCIKLSNYFLVPGPSVSAENKMYLDGDNCTSSKSNIPHQLKNSRKEAENQLPAPLPENSHSFSKIDESDNDKTEYLHDSFEKYGNLALWPESLTGEFIENCLLRDVSFFQNRRSEGCYPESVKQYKEQSRSFTNMCFEKFLKNVQKIFRSWLFYSPKKISVYCFPCKL